MEGMATTPMFKVGWRIPVRTKHKAEVRAAHLGIKPGKYITRLIEKDCETELEENWKELEETTQ